MQDRRRVHYVDEVLEVYKRICFATNNVAAFEPEDRYYAIGNDVCFLVSTQINYFDTWITSCIHQKLEHKRSFDVGYSHSIFYRYSL